MNATPYIKNIANTLKECDPYLIVVFGSQVKGITHEDSDIDLLVVTKDNFVPTSFKEKSEIHLKVNKLIREFTLQTPIDLIVLTLAMYKELIKSEDVFIKEIVTNGITLYESKHPQMA